MLHAYWHTLKILCFVCALSPFLGAQDVVAQNIESTSIYAKDAQVIHIDAILTHISLFDDKIFAGNAEGGIDIFTLNSAKHARKVASINLPLIEDYFGNKHPSRVYDVATFDGKELFILCEASLGKRQILKLNLKDTKNVQVVLTTTSAPKRMRTAGKDRLVLGFLSNEIKLYDLNKQTFLYTAHASVARFSDLCVNMPYIFSTDESGIVNVFNAESGALLQRLAINKDNNYQVVSAKHTILTAGVDKQMAIFTFADSKKQDTIDFTLQRAASLRSEFLIYAVGISPQAQWAAFTKNEQNDISLVRLDNMQEYFVLKGSSSLVNTLLFYDEHTLISGNDDKSFVIWRF